jgi:ABC-2 type transport system permease protein
VTAIYILWLRELRAFSRSRSQVLIALLNPLIYLFSIGLGMNSVFREAGRGSYLQFVTPGIVAMTVVYGAAFSGVSLLFDRQFGSLREALVSPTPRLNIMLGRTLGAATVAVLQGVLVALVCTVVGFKITHFEGALLAVLLLALIAVVFAGIGTTVGAILTDMHGFQVALNLLVTPLLLLSGALYPVDDLPQSLALIIAMNPLSYGIEGLHNAILGEFHRSLLTDGLILASLAALFIGLGAWRFSKMQV